jgi:hypothetical protein
MDKYPINKEKYRQVRNKHIKRLAMYFSILMLITFLFLFVSFYIIKMDFVISIISMASALVVVILVIYFTLKNIMKIYDEIILNTIYEINEENITISNKTENIIIEKNKIKKIERYENNSIGITMNKSNRKIIYSNCIDNYNEFCEKLNKLHEIQEYGNKTANILLGIFGGILLLSMVAVKDMFPHKIYGLLSGVIVYGLTLIFFMSKLRNKTIGKKLKKLYIIGTIVMAFLLLETIFKYILKI